MSELQIIGAPASNYVWSVRIFAHERGATYELVPDRPHAGAPARIHPFGKIPVLRHGEFELAESRAIAGYIDAVAPGEKLFPADPRKAAEIEQWISIGNSVVDPCFIRRYVVPYVFAKDGVPDRAKIDAAAEEMKPILAKLDTRLAAKPFLGGDSYSYADANVTPMLFYLGRFPEGKAALAEAVNVASYLRRMMDRPSFGAAKPPPPPQN